MTKGSYRIWENVILIISVLMAIAFWIFSLINKTEIPPSAAVIFIVMASALFAKPIWLLARIGKFTERAEAIVIDCVSKASGKAYIKIYTFKFSDSRGNVYEIGSGGSVLALFKEGKSYNIRFDPADPGKFIAVPMAYYQAAFSAVIGIIVEIILILIMIILKG